MDGVTVGRALVDVPVRCLAEDRALFAAFDDDALCGAHRDTFILFFQRSAAVLGEGKRKTYGTAR